MLWRRGIVQWCPILQACVLVINSPLLILHSIKSAQKTLLCHRDRVPMWLGGIILDSACNYSTRRLVSSPLDDLCIDIWISVMIISEPRWQRDRVQQCTSSQPDPTNHLADDEKGDSADAIHTNHPHHHGGHLKIINYNITKMLNSQVAQLTRLALHGEPD